METCKERIKEHYKDFKKMLDKASKYQDDGYIYNIGDEVYLTQKAENENKADKIYDDLRTLLDHRTIEEGTFDNNKKYELFQFSWGGPQDEVRVYEDGTAEYWFLDWFDGANVKMTQEYVDILRKVYN